jgi:hypothetical protein
MDIEVLTGDPKPAQTAGGVSASNRATLLVFLRCSGTQQAWHADPCAHFSNRSEGWSLHLPFDVPDEADCVKALVAAINVRCCEQKHPCVRRTDMIPGPGRGGR